MGMCPAKISNVAELDRPPAPVAAVERPATAEVLNQVAARLAANPNRLFANRQARENNNNQDATIAPPNSPR